MDVSHISGNASDEVKKAFSSPASFLTRPEASGQIFGASIVKKMVVTEISVDKKAEEPRKLECRFVLELTVGSDMVNGAGNIHGGCSAFLIDICSTLALAAYNMADLGHALPSVSQSLSIVYHSPATVGDRLRIVNTTMTVGSRAHSARTEIWNLTHHRLVSSGVHIKMQPSQPKANL